MEKQIDARGMQCPLPLIKTKRLLEGMSEGEVKVLVDNSIAVQNLIKMAKQKNLTYSSEKVNDDNFTVRITVNKTLDGVTSRKEKKEVADQEVCHTDSRKENTIVVLSSDHMGEGDEKLGKALMKSFIYALTELDKLPTTILLFNGGAKLSVEGSDLLEDLKLLESQGVEILTCGTCLNFYEITEKLAVGSVTNMYSIAELMMSATKIIKP